MNTLRFLKLVIRLIAGIALLAGAAWWVGFDRLRAPLMQADLRWWLVALAFSIASNVVSAWRWARIARALGLHAPLAPITAAYAQAMTINLFVPGATVGGDAFRAMRLQALGNGFGKSAASVVLDRGSGVWMLALLSLLVGLTAAELQLFPADFAMLPWGLGLGAIVIGPILILLAPTSPAILNHVAVLSRVTRLHQLIVERHRALVRSLGDSIVVQLLSAAALWACARALGEAVAYPLVLAVAAPIFIAGALPMSIAGFGAREFAALLCFPLVGVAAAPGVSTALLYGVCGVAQGLLAAPLLMSFRQK
ncbi:MAG TPA: lysylphosphatidylglycerol synthase transmembrane domain-containing protein [Burkholderiaceae bacterium]|nr:lysylphosphatidylglycerol synthase transmembrane domain-containing protein [Burkholderiaceae bacterium]